MLPRHPSKPHGVAIDALVKRVEQIAAQVAQLQTAHQVVLADYERCVQQLQRIRPQDPTNHGGLTNDQLAEQLKKIEAALPPPPPHVPAFPVGGFGNTRVASCVVDGRRAWDICWEYDGVPLTELRYFPETHDVERLPYVPSTRRKQVLEVMYTAAARRNIDATKVNERWIYTVTDALGGIKSTAVRPIEDTIITMAAGQQTIDRAALTDVLAKATSENRPVAVCYPQTRPPLTARSLAAHVSNPAGITADGNSERFVTQQGEFVAVQGNTMRVGQNTWTVLRRQQALEGVVFIIDRPLPVAERSATFTDACM